MKPVLHEIIDKNGGKSTEFNPTARMVLFATYKAKRPTETEEEVLASMNCGTDLHKKWSKQYGTHYTGWLEEMIDQHSQDGKYDILEAVGMVKAVQGSFQHWKEMAKVHGLIKEEVKNVSVTINTDFSKFKGLDFEEYRRRILESTRGVDYAPRYRVADDPVIAKFTGVPDSGSNSGPGGGTVPVQSEPVEVPNALGKDRGCGAAREAVSAVPVGPSLIRADTILAGIPVAAHSKESSDDSDMAF